MDTRNRYFIFENVLIKKFIEIVDSIEKTTLLPFQVEDPILCYV